MNKLKTAGRRRIWALVLLLGLLSGPAWVHAQSAVEITPLPDVEVVVTPLEEEPAPPPAAVAPAAAPAGEQALPWFWLSLLPLPLLLAVAGSLVPWRGRERWRRKVLPLILLAHVVQLLAWAGLRHGVAGDGASVPTAPGDGQG